MTASDWIAGYGAVLATFLAAVQVLQWNRSRRFLSVKYNEFFGDEDSTVEAIIANRGQFAVTLDFVACGYSVRYWKSFWRREAMNIWSMAQITDYGEDGAILGKPVDGRTLGPGELVRVGVLRSRLDSMRTKQNSWEVFSHHPCIWIEHSQSDNEICQVIRTTL